MENTDNDMWYRLRSYGLQHAENTSVHGWGRLSRDNNGFARILWLLFIGTSLIVFTFHVYILVDLYFQKPSAIVYRPRHEKFEPPDIYVCNINPISQSQLFLRRGLDNDQYIKQADGIFDFFAKFMNLSGINPHLLAKIAYAPTMGHKKMSEVAGHKASQMFLKTAISWTLVNNPTQFQHHRYTNCFFLRPTFAQFSSPDNFVELEMFTDSFQTKLAQTNSASLDINTWKSGIRLFFVQKDHYPEDTSTSIVLAPGFRTEIRLSLTKIYNHPLKNNCSERPIQRAIINPLTLEQNVYLFGTNYCVVQKFLRTLVGKCGCLAGIFYIPEEFKNIPFCFDVKFLAQMTSSQINSTIHCVLYALDSIVHQEISFQDSCLHRSHCRQEKYEIRWSMSRCPKQRCHRSVADKFAAAYNRATKKKNQSIDAWQDIIRNRRNPALLETIINENYVQALIKPADAWSTHIREVLTYPLANLFSDIGGILGLYLGFSLLTLFEILELLTINFVLCFEFAK